MNRHSLLFYQDGFSVNGYKFRTRDQTQNLYWILKFRNHFEDFDASKELELNVLDKSDTVISL